MPSPSAKPVRPEMRHIDVGGEAELRGWAKRFGVTAEVLRGVVASVGGRPEDVASHLKQWSDKPRSRDRDREKPSPD